MKRTRKGFTLVELLIVIAILGALASMMTLSSGTAASKAKASAIIAGFKMVKTAATMYVVDSADTASVAYFSSTASDDYVGAESLKQLGKYSVAAASDDSTQWTATYNFGTADDVAAKCKTIADELGGITVTIATGASTAAMRVR